MERVLHANEETALNPDPFDPVEPEFVAGAVVGLGTMRQGSDAAPAVPMSVPVRPAAERKRGSSFRPGCRLRRYRRPGRLPDPEGGAPPSRAEGIAGAEPLSGKPTRSGRRVCRSALQFPRDVAAASPHDRLGPPAGTANRVDWPTFGLAVLGRVTARGLAGAEGRSHLRGSGRRRQCLPGVAPHSLSLRGGTASSNPSSSTEESANFQSLTTKVFVLVLWISRSIPYSEAFRQQHPNGTRSPLRRRCAESAG
jgi:hypothetical protein